MKGLLVKDMRMMLGQRTTLVLMGLVAMMMFFSQSDVTIALGYFVVLGVMFSLGSMNYDAVDNGMAFIMTLPIRRRVYVYEKYVFILATAALLGVVGSVLAIVLRDGNIAAVAEACWGTFLMAGFVTAFMLPVQFKFGPEKSRLVLVLVVGVVAVSVLMASTIMENMTNGQEGLDGAMLMMQKFEGILIVLGVLAVMALSVFLSVRIIEKKEY